MEKNIDYSTMKLEQDKTNLSRVIVTVFDRFGFEKKIAQYNFENKSGFIQIEGVIAKSYRTWKPLLNQLFKLNEFFGWSSKEVENAKTQAKFNLENEG